MLATSSSVLPLASHSFGGFDSGSPSSGVLTPYFRFFSSLPWPESLPSTASIKLYTAGYLSHVIGHSQVTRESLLNLLCPCYVTRQKFQELLATDLRPCRVTHESPSDLRPIYEGLATDIQASPALATREKFPTILNRSIWSGNLCRVMVSPPELLRVFMSNLRPSDK